MEDVDIMQASARREHHLAIVDSTTRDQTLCPHPSNYFVEFPKPFKNVFGVELVDAYLPRSMYTVDEFNNEIVFGIYVDNVLVKSKFTFVPQNYNISTLIEALSSSVGVTTGDGEVVNLTVSAHSADDPTRTSRLQIVSDYRFVIWSSQSSANEVIGFGEARADANGMPYLGDDYAAYLSTADQEYDQGAVDLAGGAAAAADALIARGASRTVLLRQDDLGVTATVGLSAEATHVTFWARDPLVRTDISCAVACVQDAAWTVLSSETLPASAVSVVLDDSSGLWAITADLGAAVKAAREGRGLSHRAVSKATGIDLGSLCRIERGDRDIRVSMLLRLAEACEVRGSTVLRRAEDAAAANQEAK